MLFPLWGFANDVTKPVVKAFNGVFLVSNAQSSMVVGQSKSRRSWQPIADKTRLPS